LFVFGHLFSSPTLPQLALDDHLHKIIYTLQKDAETTCCFLPTAYCLLLSAYCLLPTAFCFLPTAFCLLPSAYGSTGLSAIVAGPPPWSPPRTTPLLST